MNDISAKLENTSKEFKKHRDEVDELKRKNLELTQRVQVLERELASMK